MFLHIHEVRGRRKGALGYTSFRECTRKEKSFTILRMYSFVKSYGFLNIFLKIYLYCVSICCCEYTAPCECSDNGGQKRIPGTGVTDGCKLTMDAGLKPGTSGRAAMLLLLSHLSSLKIYFFSFMWILCLSMPGVHGGQKRASDALEMPSLYLFLFGFFLSMSNWQFLLTILTFYLQFFQVKEFLFCFVSKQGFSL